MVYLCSKWTPDVQINYFIFDCSIYRLFVLNKAGNGLFPNIDIRICLLDMKHSWTKNAFWDVNKKKWRKWCKFVSPYLFNNTYGLKVLRKETKCPNQDLMFDWLIYRPIVPNKGWKNDSLQMMLFVSVFSTWSIVELKTRLETWIKRNVNGVSLFHLSYLITLMAYLCLQWTPNVQINYFIFDW
jgi:hypothetical protein